MKHMLDTNVFNRILDGKFDPSILAKHSIVATHVQKDELSNTADGTRKSALLEVFDEFVTEFVPTNGAVWDVSRFDQSKYGDSDRYRAMLDRLKKLDKKPSSKWVNQARDVLIAETAIQNSFTLLTADTNLAQVVEEFGGKAVPPSFLTSSAEPES